MSYPLTVMMITRFIIATLAKYFLLTQVFFKAQKCSAERNVIEFTK